MFSLCLPPVQIQEEPEGAIFGTSYKLHQSPVGDIQTFHQVNLFCVQKLVHLQDN